MSRYKTVYTEVEVDVSLEDFATEDLVEELESRGSGTMDIGNGRELLEKIYLLRREDRDYQRELDELIYAGLGRIV
jgi:hypothetical protein